MVMELRSRALVLRTLLLSTLVAAACLALPAALAQRADTSVAHVDGYVTVSPDGRCMVLKQHDGSLFSLFGHRRGLTANDHVRLEGRIVAESRCGAQSGFEVTSVQAVWADDNHRSTYYDHLKDGTFGQWVVRNRPQATDPYERHR
jgi:hypothetical protein